MLTFFELCTCIVSFPSYATVDVAMFYYQIRQDDTLAITIEARIHL